MLYALSNLPPWGPSGRNSAVRRGDSAWISRSLLPSSFVGVGAAGKGEGEGECEGMDTDLAAVAVVAAEDGDCLPASAAGEGLPWLTEDKADAL